MWIIIASGALKNSLSALEAGEAILAGLQQSGLAFNYKLLPLADGGNGTVDVMLSLGAQRCTVPVTDPLSRPIQADYAYFPETKTAVIEMALASGLELLKSDELNPLLTTTYGTGQLILDALNRELDHLVIGLGGSATIDGGIGILSALGLIFYDAQGQPLKPIGANLIHMDTIATRNLDPRLQNIKITLASDVENVTVGSEGAAYVFGQQKGATPSMITELDQGLTHWCDLIAEKQGRSFHAWPGGGAAGGVSVGLSAFLDCERVSGIDWILDFVNFDELLTNADLVITSEGRIDTQTLYGKGPLGIAQRASRMNVPSVCLVGASEVDEMALHEAGLNVIFPIISKPMSLEDAISQAADLMRNSALRLAYLLQLIAPD